MSTHAIWKYPLALADEQSIEMPEGATVLSVQAQNGAVTLWAEVRPYHPLKARRFRIYGTGHPIDRNNLKYIGTVQMPSSFMEQLPFVWHIFEEVKS